MIVSRRFPRRMLLTWAFRHLAVVGSWAAMIFVAYVYGGLTFLRVPFLPIATIGTAVAFYIGFKNNAAYDRFWEGRKIWGGIVNESRTWAVAVMNYIDPAEHDEESAVVHRALVYRHLAWINALRLQLRKTSRFHDNPAAITKKRLDSHAAHMRNDWDTELKPFLDEAELAEVSGRRSPSTHMLARQSKELAALVENGRLDMFRQLELMGIVRELYALQGKCERIKNTPFPRQYAEFSRIFVRTFVFLMPFGMLDVFAEQSGPANLGSGAAMVIASALVGWVFLTMEGIGDSSEDPFERSMNDVPMNALCRTIEIDLRELLGETELPEKEQAAGFVMY